MLNNPEQNCREWLKKASDDELNAKSILTHRDGTPSAVCFLSQQMAEKLLKGLIVFNHAKFKKVHDLLEIETLLLDIVPDVDIIEAELDLLNTYYTETRYPGDFPEFTWKEAEEAFSAAEKVKSFVLSKLNQ